MARHRGDFGENFVEKERQFRFRKNLTNNRAKSEIGEISRQKNGLPNRSSVVHMNSSFQSDVSSYMRPKLSFEPASSSKVSKNRINDWCEIERNYISNHSSAESDLDRDDDSREEMISYNFRPIDLAPSRQSNQRNYSKQNLKNGSRKSLINFDEREIYYFGVVQLSPEKAHMILTNCPPPSEYRMLSPIERTAYLYYYTLYRKYITPVDTFHRVFNREFYKYTCDGDSNDVALWKICKHTQEEYKRQIIKKNKEAYDLSQKRLFSDERDSPDSRNSEHPSFCDHESDSHSLESSKEPFIFTRPHATVSFAVGGRIVYLDPDFSVNTIRVEDLKKFCVDRNNQRNIEALESFKGPLIVGEIQPQTPLLFIQRQINRICRSDVYRANPTSSDANDCLLIWNLLEVLIRQQGKVTGPDLAQLLIADYSYSSFKAQSFTKDSESNKNDILKNEQHVDDHSMDKFTQYLLGGHIEEAIDVAMQEGLLFDALFLAHRIFRNDRKKLNEIEAKLLIYRKPQHPVMTLLSVAGETAVPLLSNTTADDANGWRAHIAIILANLQTQTAISTVYEMGLALAQKEFNSAADFCFLAVNLLTEYNCFSNVDSLSDDINARRGIKLISASLPDDEEHSTQTRFGWSILDFQATEIFDYALKLKNMSSVTGVTSFTTPLSQSIQFQKCRLNYSILLSEYGGFNSNVFGYCTDIAHSVWNYASGIDPKFISQLCDLADRFQYVSNCDDEQKLWIKSLSSTISSQENNNAFNQMPTEQQSQEFQSTHQPSSLTSLSTQSLHNPQPIVSSFSLQGLTAQQGQIASSFSIQPLPSQTSQNLEFNNITNSEMTSNVILNYTYNSGEKLANHIDSLLISKADKNNDMIFQDENYSDNIQLEGNFRPQQQFQRSRFSSTISNNDQNTNSFENQDDNVDSANVVPIDFSSYYTQGASSLNFELPAPPEIPLDTINSASQNFSTLPVLSNANLTENKNLSDFNNIGTSVKSTDNLASNSVNTNKVGLFSSLKNRIGKIIPNNNSMILPDDTNPSIVWDGEKFVGDGVEEKAIPPPPPIKNDDSEQNQQLTPPYSSSLQFNDLMQIPVPKPGNEFRSKSLQKRYHNPGYF